jgi:thiosulfate dehydrogenase [quinone] large subunit
MWYYLLGNSGEVPLLYTLGRKEPARVTELMTSRNTVIQDPPIIVKPLNDIRFAWLWTALRLYVGWQLLSAGWAKFADPAWVETGEALKVFWAESLTLPTQGTHFVICSWYKAYIAFMLNGGHYIWFSRLIIFAEIAVGLALITGAFTAIAALLAAFMSWNLLMSGCTGANALILPLALALVPAWKIAGYQGLDRLLLPKIGTLWGRNVTLSVSTGQPPGQAQRTFTE